MRDNHINNNKKFNVKTKIKQVLADLVCNIGVFGFRSVLILPEADQRLKGILKDRENQCDHHNYIKDKFALNLLPKLN